MAISDQQIFDWFLANPNADDATIASTMDQFKLSPEDIARATGTDVGNVTSRYEAVQPAGGLSAVTGGQSVLEDTSTFAPATTTGGLPTTVNAQFAGKDYNLAVSDVDKVKNQILSQGTTSQWTGEGFGSPEANAEAMAKNLVASGVTDIYQVGQKEITTPGYTTQTEAGEEVVPDSTQTVLINKATGQQLISDYDRSGGSAWSGTFTGEGNTAFRTSFDASGKPIFYTTGASSNDIVNLIGDDPILGKVATAAAAYFGGPAGVAALQAAMGKDIEDIAKGALLAYAGGEIAQGVSGATVDTLGATGANIAGKAAGQFVSSEGKADIGNLLLSGGIDAGANEIANNIDGFNNLSAGEQSFVKNVVKTTIQNGGDLSLGNVIDAALTAGTTAANASKTGTIATAIKADETVNNAVGNAASTLATKDVASTVGDGATGVDQLNLVGGLEDQIATTELDRVARETKLNDIANASTFNQAYADARALLGSGKVFTWNGKQYTTDTREENPSLAAASDAARLNNIAASTEAGGGRGSAASYATYDAKAAADALNKTKVIPDLSAGDEYGFNDTVYDPATGVALLNSNATADPNTALGRAVISANNALGSVVQTGLSNLANAGGEQLAAFGGVLATIGATDANNMLVQAGKAAQQVGSAIETEESKQGTQNIINAVSKADGMGGKLIAGLKAGWENPTAALNLITREGFQEILPAGVALKASKIMSLAAAAGIDTALNAGESMGQAYNDAYSAAIAKGMTKEAADALATQVGLSAGAITLVTSGVMDAALIKTVFREGSGTVSSQLVKGSTKEGISENIEETATALATQYLTTGKIDLGDAMTQGALGHLIGKTTAGSVGAVDVAAQTETINNNITAAVTSGDAASVNTAITNSVQQSLSSGASVELSVGASINSAITNGVDAGSSITSAVTSAVTNGADVSQTVTSSIDSAITAGADTSVAINSTVTSAITSGADVSQTVSGAITAATTAGVNANTAITNTVNSAVTASITSGADVATSVNSAVNSAITSAVTSNSNTTTAVDSSVSSAINAAVTSNANVTTAVDSAVTTAITTAISSNVNANTAVTTAVNSAVTTAINSNVNANTAITTSVTAAINAAVSADTNVTTSVNNAVTSAVNAAVTTGVDVTTAVNAAVNAAISTNVNIDLKDLTKIATDAATTATEKVDLITSVTDLISGTPSTPTTPTTPKTPSVKAPTKTPEALTAGLMAGMVGGADLGRLPPTMLKAYMTQDKFVDPLAQLHALQEGMNTEKMESLPQVNTQEPDMPDLGTWKYGNAPDDIDTLFAEEEAPAFKAGGYVAPLQMASGGAMPLPLLAKSGGALGALPRPDGRMDFRHGAHVAGEGDGQSDDIKAMLADGEFVFPADVVSALGNGSTKAGSDKLYEMMHAIRERARSKKPKDLPPPALKSPLDYLKKR